MYSVLPEVNAKQNPFINKLEDTLEQSKYENLEEPKLKHQEALQLARKAQ